MEPTVERRELISCGETYSHLSGEGIFMELKDILKTKQLPLAFLVILDTLEIPTPTAVLATGVEV